MLTRQPNSFSTITHKVPVALNPGGLSYEVKYARGGVLGADGGISGPSSDAFVDRNTGLADARFTEPGRYVMVARDQERRLLHAVERPDQLPGQGAVRPLLRRLPGPERSELQAARDAARRLRPRQRVTVYYAKGKKGGKFRKLGRCSKINSKKAFTLRFTMRQPGTYRLQYRFKGTQLVLGGKVTEAIQIRRPIRFAEAPSDARPARGRGAGTRDRAPRVRLSGDARARPVAELPQEALRAPLHAPVIQPQRVGDVPGRRAVDQHREQREVVPVDQVGGGVELGGGHLREGGCRRGPRRGRPRRARRDPPACRRGRPRRRRGRGARGTGRAPRCR